MSAVAPDFELRTVPPLGRTLIALRTIRAGELVLRETALLIASPLHRLPRPLRRKYIDGAAALGLHLDDLLIVHAAARASADVRAIALAEFCSIDACGEEHAIVASARLTASWCRENDPECAGIPLEDLERLLCAFTLNGFGYLADGKTGGLTSLYQLGSKFTHRCIDPSVTFHGQDGALAFRTLREVAAGEVLTISYLGPWGRTSIPARRRLLYETKGFACFCDDCRAPDLLRKLPCPHCAPRDPQSNLLPVPPVAQDKLHPSSAVMVRSAAPAIRAADGPVELGVAEPSVVPAGHPSPLAVRLRPPTELPGSWRCASCGFECDDAALDTACCAPTEPWGGAVGGNAGWPLQLPPSTLLSWEAALEEAACNLMTAMLTPDSSHAKAVAKAPIEAAPVHPSLRRMPRLILGARAVLGEAHWVVFSLLELQLDHWLEVRRPLPL